MDAEEERILAAMEADRKAVDDIAALLASLPEDYKPIRRPIWLNGDERTKTFGRAFLDLGVAFPWYFAAFVTSFLAIAVMASSGPLWASVGFWVIAAYFAYKALGPLAMMLVQLAEAITGFDLRSDKLSALVYRS